MFKPIALIALMFIVGCEANPDRPDPDRILHMAGDEAGQIAAPKERFTRQLNIANRETGAGKPANAMATLTIARTTLEQADKNAFNDQDRLAGWVSLCELSREANDKVFANSALDQAIAAMNQVTPESARCEYVPGIAREVKEVRGNAAAAAMLHTATDWVKGLPERETRRRAYYAFAKWELYCIDYDGAKETLRKDDDPAWRSDSLIALSEVIRYGEGYGSPRAAAPGSIAAGQIPQTQGAESFGKSLDFQTNYYRQK